LFEIQLHFLNTQWYETQKERRYPLMDPQWIKWFVQKLTNHELAETTPPMDFEALSAALTIFRGELIQLVSTIETGDFSETEAIALLNRYLVKTEGHRSIQFDGASSQTQTQTQNETSTTATSSSSTPTPTPAPIICFEPILVDDSYILSELAYQWFLLLFENDRTRIKICEDPDCVCYFYDESKNKSKRHCTNNCSNRMKVRRHRKKKQSLEDQD
jgi:predicted RNA-binding Zn ribbon-like protein